MEIFRNSQEILPSIGGSKSSAFGYKGIKYGKEIQPLGSEFRICEALVKEG